ncbi:MAG: drug resistance transporter, EmrB/QacA subfamily [Anaerolineales bacterium]|nr:drug resistance transporter, EmrB/QacA subfamily [Anaerolineales bacterium]
MSRKRVVVITAGLMLSLFLASMEITVVATAMPTIVSQLGGLAAYSWVFSAYMLASTTTVPLYGKLSDLYGRRPIYALAIGLFLVGSLLCGQARSMSQLIAFRAVQGLGAGGLIPLAFIIIGDLFTFEQRAHMQGVFSSVWGVSSLVGPLLGGFLVDRVSWHWVFYINLVPGLLAGALVWLAWRDAAREPNTPAVSVDYAGAGLLTAGIVTLLLGLFELGTTLSWVLLGAAAALFLGLAWVEQRAADPILPLPLFRDRMFAVSCLHGLLAGCAVFGSTAFVPLFAQAVLGTSATVAGAALTPQVIAWTLASVAGGQMLLRMSFRAVALIGMILLTAGTVLLALTNGEGASYLGMVVYLALMGVGMGLSIPAFLIAVQSTVSRRVLGTATSTLQFSRSIGGTLGVSIMGAALTLRLFSGLREAGLDPAGISVDSLLDPVARATSSLNVEGVLRTALAAAIQNVFVIALVAAALGLAATAFAPTQALGSSSARPTGAESAGEPVRTTLPGP